MNVATAHALAIGLDCEEAALAMIDLARMEAGRRSSTAHCGTDHAEPSTTDAETARRDGRMQRGRAVGQLAGLITRRSWVRIPPALLTVFRRRARWGVFAGVAR